MQRIQPAHADQLDGIRHSCGRRFRGGSKQQAEAWAESAELRRRTERDVDLERAEEKEDPIEGLGMAHIQVMDGTMLAIHHLGPVGDHLRTVGVGGEAQGEIDVRPRSSRPSAADPVSAAPQMRPSVRATETSSSRSRSRSSAENTGTETTDGSQTLDLRAATIGALCARTANRWRSGSPGARAVLLHLGVGFRRLEEATPPRQLSTPRGGSRVERRVPTTSPSSVRCSLTAVAFPIGPAGTPQILNRSEVPARVLICATNNLPGVAEQVENDTLAVITSGGLRLVPAPAPVTA